MEGLRDITLVGHSYAGMVITGVADRMPERIAHLVFEDALLPRDGESALGAGEALEAAVGVEVIADRGVRTVGDAARYISEKFLPKKVASN